MKTEATNEKIAGAVRRELDWDPKVNANALGVTVEDGAVVLTGVVSSNAEKLAAVRAAERVFGVRAVASELRVELPGDSVVVDELIAESIARQLRSNTLVPATVQADVQDGYVTLRGAVQWMYQREAAEHPINLVRGVCAVTNLITIEPHEKVGAELGQQVREAMGRMADLDARSIEVTTSAGTVQLHGSVHTFGERRTAERAAAAAPGVSEVQNELAVTP